MKKQYKTPITESVKVKLYNSILDSIGVVNNSHDVTDEGLAKEQKDFFDIDDNDLWADGGDTGSSYDLWNE